MLTKEEWLLAENGNDEIAYKEYCQVTENLTTYFLKLFVPFSAIFVLFHFFSK